MLIKFIQTLLLLPCFISIAVAQPNSSDEIFNLLNLEYPGLEKVNQAFQNGKLKKARAELLSYYQHLSKRKWIEDETVEAADIDQADQNMKNIFLIKSLQYDFGGKINWKLIHKDKEWQFTLNKMKWFNNFVAAYQQTGDEKYVRAWMSQVKSWIELGDPGYPRTIDSGRRLDNWVASYWMLVHELKSPSITPEFNAEMLFSMAQQAAFLYNPDHWRRYSNWGSFENSGFSKFIIILPEFKRNEAWLKEIFFRMHFQLTESYHDDGMHIEVSPGYHAHELQVWFDFIRLAELNGVTNPWHTQIPLPPPAEYFLQPAKALMQFYKPTGVMPQVGDTDEADERDFLLELGDFWNMPDLVYVASDGKQGHPPQKTSAAFPAGGYYIMRSGWGNDDLAFNEELYLLFDCGTNYPWHAHYDMLNIVATAYGHDLLKDAGRFTYSDGPDRDYFKSTRAHNTIVIDKTDQPRYYTPAQAEWYSMSGFDYVIGTQSSHSDVTQQRSVLFVRPHYWIVVDRLDATDSHHYDQYWHFSEKAVGKVEITPSGHQVTTPHLMLFFLSQQAKLNVADGWLSYHYRRKVRAPVIRYSLSSDKKVILPTVLYPFQSKMPGVTVDRLEIESGNNSATAVAMQISTQKGIDFFLEQEYGGHVTKTNEFETDAKMVFASFDDQNNLISYHLVQGSFLNYRGRQLVRIAGKPGNISVSRKRVEIEGKFITAFKLRVDGKPEVFLNDEKIEVERKGKSIWFN